MIEMNGIFKNAVITKDYIAIFAWNGETVFFKNFKPILVTRITKIFRSFEKKGYTYLFYESFEKFFEWFGKEEYVIELMECPADLVSK